MRARPLPLPSDRHGYRHVPGSLRPHLHVRRTAGAPPPRAGRGLPAVLRRARASGARRGCLAGRRARQTLSGRLQQRARGRPCASRCGRGAGAAGGGAEHPHPLSARRRGRVRGAAAGLVPRGPGQRHVHLHRQRGQRPGAARRDRGHRPHGLHRHPQRLSRRDALAGGHVTVAAPRGQPCAHGAAARQLPRRPGAGRLALRRGRRGRRRRTGPGRHARGRADGRHRVRQRRHPH
ncbi:hypothetical protein LMG26858_03073 [Achromobacter anxifer]|uniref:Uncharacterized protein n=1 Tax=Achromobacter anxifer TaxID=1287737 RepID=A0A6S7DR32_9BURK|nr:hypothetical protein LMG26858_03073 [Achromobacter anxifer]